jgi:hypothetical protein
VAQERADAVLHRKLKHGRRETDGGQALSRNDARETNGSVRAPVRVQLSLGGKLDRKLKHGRRETDGANKYCQGTMDEKHFGTRVKGTDLKLLPRGSPGAQREHRHGYPEERVA